MRDRSWSARTLVRLRETRDAFESYLSREVRSPAGGIESMLAFYRSSRVRGCDLESQGDMLLFQWGTYDWGDGERFEINVTRQLISVGRAAWLLRAMRIETDPEFRQLSLTYRFEPEEPLRDLGSGSQWCDSPAGLAEFEEFIRGADAFKSVAKRVDCTMSLEFGLV